MDRRHSAHSRLWPSLALICTLPWLVGWLLGDRDDDAVGDGDGTTEDDDPPGLDIGTFGDLLVARLMEQHPDCAIIPAPLVRQTKDNKTPLIFKERKAVKYSQHPLEGAFWCQSFRL